MAHKAVLKVAPVVLIQLRGPVTENSKAKRAIADLHRIVGLESLVVDVSGLPLLNQGMDEAVDLWRRQLSS
jgi:hypothetical protein